MKDVVVTIQPIGWITILAIVVAIYLFGYILGFYHSWRTHQSEHTFDFEKEKNEL